MGLETEEEMNIKLEAKKIKKEMKVKRRQTLYDKCYHYIIHACESAMERGENSFLFNPKVFVSYSDRRWILHKIETKLQESPAYKIEQIPHHCCVMNCPQEEEGLHIMW